MDQEKPSLRPIQSGGERVIRIETQLTYLQEQQKKVEAQHEKMMDALDALIRRSDVHENTEIAVKDSLTAHEREIEGIGKILVNHSNQLNRIDIAVKYVVAPFVTLVLGYLFALFAHIPK